MAYAITEMRQQHQAHQAAAVARKRLSALNMA
jgi:hypothetical protein